MTNAPSTLVIDPFDPIAVHDLLSQWFNFLFLYFRPSSSSSGSTYPWYPYPSASSRSCAWSNYPGLAPIPWASLFTNPRNSSRSSKKPIYLHGYHCNHVSHLLSYSLYDFLSYNSLSDTYKAFILNISIDTEPKFFHQTIKFPEWQQAIKDEIQAW